MLLVCPETPAEVPPTHIFLRSHENHLNTPKKRRLLDIAEDYDARISHLALSPQPLSETDTRELRRLQRELRSLYEKLARWVLENVGEELGQIFEKEGATLSQSQFAFLIQQFEHVTLNLKCKNNGKQIDDLTHKIQQLEDFKMSVTKQLCEAKAATKKIKEELEAEKRAHLQTKMELKKKIKELQERVTEQNKLMEEKNQEIASLKGEKTLQEKETEKITTALQTRTCDLDGTKRKLIKTRRAQKNQVKQIRYWRKKCLEKNPTFEQRIKDLEKNALVGEAYISMLNMLPQTTTSLLERVAKKANGNKFNGEYGEDIRCFAQTLYHYSPAAYDYVRKSFKNALPHRGTISCWLAQIEADPGFGGEAYNAIRAAVARFKDAEGKAIKASLIQDEISIKKHLEYCGSKVYGYVDMGDNKPVAKDTPQASYAQCFMIVGLNLRLRLPCGYFFIKTLTAKERAKLTVDCINALEAAGVEIENITFDGTQTNATMAKCLGAQVDEYKNLKPFFTNPADENRVVNVVLDAAHMLKNIRNCLGDKESLFDKNGGRVDWKYIKKLQEIQAKDGLNFANKLNKQHIEYWKKKMKVKLAAQTFSESVAKALEQCLKLMIEGFEGAEPTIKFIRMVFIFLRYIAYFLLIYFVQLNL